MTRLNVTITYVPANFLKYFTKFVLKYIVPNRRWYSNHLSVSLLEYWAFSQHWHSVVTILSTNLVFTFLTMVISASYFLEWASKSLTSVVSLAICETKLASVLKIRCTRSGLLSLLRQPQCEFKPYQFTRYNKKNKK